MSVFETANVEEVIIGTTVASQATVPTFIASAADKSIKAVAADGGAAGQGKSFKVLQKTGGNASKGLNYEFSDVIDPAKVQKVILAPYKNEVQKVVTVSGLTGNVVSNATYSVEIRLYNDGGTLSPENFATISGYYVTGTSVANETAATIRDGLIKSLNANLNKRGASEFTVAASGADITITSQFQNVVAGKIVGRPIEFEVTAKQFDNASATHENLGLLTATVTTPPVYGVGTGKYAVNLEWFSKGTKYEVYREVSYPANFNTPYYADPNGIYNVVHIKYFSDRTSPTVEVQPKVLTVLVLKSADTLPANAATNSFLANLRTFLPTALVPVDLPVTT